MLVLSTTTATPWFSKRWSSSLGASKARAYWKPEQPPPRTATRRACSVSFSCSPSSSLILVAALSVSVIGGTSVIAVHCRGAVGPIQVLADPVGVVHHPVAVDQHGHEPHAGELDDLGSIRPPVGDALGSIFETQLLQPTGDGAARAEHVGRRRAAVEDAAGFGHQTKGTCRRAVPVVRSARSVSRCPRARLP